MIVFGCTVSHASGTVQQRNNMSLPHCECTEDELDSSTVAWDWCELNKYLAKVSMALALSAHTPRVQLNVYNVSTC